VPLTIQRAHRPTIVQNLSLLSLLLLSSVAAGQRAASAPGMGTREVKHQSIISTELPKARLTFGKQFHCVGTQRVNLYGNAEAEQYFFVRAGKAGIVRRFYWVQFENFLPTNTRAYDYPPDRMIEIGGLQFIYDVKSWPDYAVLQVEDPLSDGAAIERLLARQGLFFPRKTVRVRMFHLPSPDHRAELMIIYGEALTTKSMVPMRSDGVELDVESPQLAQIFLQHALKNLVVRQP
jgi:hypothetical protein